MTGDAAVARARSALGARFRPQGRDPASGLDCSGLVAFAWATPAPEGYGLRGGRIDTLAAGLAARGFREADTPAPGDVLIFASGPGQWHLGIGLGEAGLIHADAALRRVVERPGAWPWPLIGNWRRD